MYFTVDFFVHYWAELRNLEAQQIEIRRKIEVIRQAIKLLDPLYGRDAELEASGLVLAEVLAQDELGITDAVERVLLAKSLAQEPKNISKAPKEKKAAEKAKAVTSQPPPIKQPDSRKPETPTSTESAKKPDNDSLIATYTKQLADSTESLATYTKLLIGVGVLQFVALFIQAGILIHHSGLIRRAIVLTQRPRLNFRHFVLDSPSVGDRFISTSIEEAVFKPRNPIAGRLTIVNSGGGSATLRNTQYHVISTTPIGPLPLEIPNTLGEPQVLAGASGRMLAAGQHQEFVFNGFGPSLQQFTAARDQGLNYLALYVVGWVDYTDELGITRRSAFCRRYEGKSDRMILAPDQEHEYTD